VNGGRKTLLALAVILTAYTCIAVFDRTSAVADERSATPPGSDTSRPSPIESLIRDGDAAQKSGDLSKAAALFQQATTLDPRSVDAWLRLGDVQVAAQDLTAAENAYKAAEAIDQDNPYTDLRLGELALMAGDANAAIDKFAHALKNHKDDAQLNNSIGVAYAIGGYYDLARQHYKAAMAVDPFNTSVQNNYGLLQLSTGDLQGALATFLALTKVSNATDRYRVNLALVYLALGRTNDALANAPGISEPQLHQMLAVYYHPKVPQDDKSSAVAGAAKPAVGLSDDSQSLANIAPTAPPPALDSSPKAESDEPMIGGAPATPSRKQPTPPTAAPSDQSIAQQAAMPATAPMAAREYRLQIGSVRSEVEALEEWKRLHRLYPDALKGLSLTVARADLGEKGIYYRLQAGPIADAGAAADRCSELSDHKVGCIVSYDHNPAGRCSANRFRRVARRNFGHEVLIFCRERMAHTGRNFDRIRRSMRENSSHEYVAERFSTFIKADRLPALRPPAASSADCFLTSRSTLTPHRQEGGSRALSIQPRASAFFGSSGTDPRRRPCPVSCWPSLRFSFTNPQAEKISVSPTPPKTSAKSDVSICPWPTIARSVAAKPIPALCDSRCETSEMLVAPPLRSIGRSA
jgi:Flp pilus assembly protein TadD